jgi:hypothetical protein
MTTQHSKFNSSSQLSSKWNLLAMIEGLVQRYLRVEQNIQVTALEKKGANGHIVQWQVYCLAAPHHGSNSGDCTGVAPI